MRRAAFALLLCGLALPARAQAPGCLDQTMMWTVPYGQGTIQAVSYYVNLSLLGVLYRTGTVHLHVSVPLRTAQGFTGLTSADSYYASRVSGHYSQALLGEQTSCPLLAETTGNDLLSE